jgi:predicted AAA+ superfamily ATPase
MMPLYPRLANSRVRQALSDTRVVVISGPRQAGKTTIARSLTKQSESPIPAERGAAPATGDGQSSVPEERIYFSLDNATTLAAALRDPTGFIRGIDRAVIDEVQRAPELLLAIKESVDIDQRPGRFLLTGSADLRTSPLINDSLAGRVETIELLPLAQVERFAGRTTFLDTVFRSDIPPIANMKLGDELLEVVL